MDRLFPIINESIHLYEDGEPCSHKGCAHHVDHPCEVCHRTMARGEAWALIRKSITKQEIIMEYKEMEKEVIKYFANLTDEQFLKDLELADYSFYKDITVEFLGLD